LISRDGDEEARFIDDNTYNGRFERLIQSSVPDYNAGLEDFKARLRPYSE